jgi:hypothetical protein
MSYSDVKQWSSAEQTLNGATDLELPFVAMSRLVITKVALRVTNNAAGGAVVTFERRVGVSTDTTIEAVTIPAADNDGIMLYTDVAPASQIEFAPGDVLNLAVSESGTAPTAVAVIEYFVVDSDLERLESATLVESA